MSDRCKFPGTMAIRLGAEGWADVDPCLYQEIETIEHCTVHVLRCKRCGHTEIEWEREKDIQAIHWHRTEDSLPEESGGYLVALTGKGNTYLEDGCAVDTVETCYYNASIRKFDVPDFYNVAFWSEIPAPPTVEAQNE